MATLHVVFFKESFNIANWLDFLHEACGLYIGNEKATDGCIYMMHHVFKNYAYKKKKTPNCIFKYDDGLTFTQGQLEFVPIKSSLAELEHISKLCDACCDQKRKYNYHDKILSIFAPVCAPLTKDVDIYNAPNLHNAQAVLLILRAGLDSENNKLLMARLNEINSREVYSTQLYRVIVQATKATIICYNSTATF